MQAHATRRQFILVPRIWLWGCFFLQPRLLIVDEGTSACDAASDALLQQTLRVAFPGCTVFTIAHRMATILDSSTIVVIRWVGAFATQA